MSGAHPGSSHYDDDHVYQFGFDHDNSMTAILMGNFLGSKGIHVPLGAKKARLLVMIEELATANQVGEGPGMRNLQSFDPAYYNTVPKKRQFLSFYHIPYPANATAPELDKLVRDNVGRLKDEECIYGNGHHLCASAVANRRSAHGASAPGLQMPPTIRLELALPRAEAAAARPEAPIARMWHLVREGRYLTALRIGLLWLVRLA